MAQLGKQLEAAPLPQSLDPVKKMHAEVVTSFMKDEARTSLLVEFLSMHDKSLPLQLLPFMNAMQTDMWGKLSSAGANGNVAENLKTMFDVLSKNVGVDWISFAKSVFVLADGTSELPTPCGNLFDSMLQCEWLLSLRAKVMMSLITFVSMHLPAIFGDAIYKRVSLGKLAMFESSLIGIDVLLVDDSTAGRTKWQDSWTAVLTSLGQSKVEELQTTFKNGLLALQTQLREEEASKASVVENPQKEANGTEMREEDKEQKEGEPQLLSLTEVMGKQFPLESEPLSKADAEDRVQVENAKAHNEQLKQTFGALQLQDVNLTLSQKRQLIATIEHTVIMHGILEDENADIVKVQRCDKKTDLMIIAGCLKPKRLVLNCWGEVSMIPNANSLPLCHIAGMALFLSPKSMSFAPANACSAWLIPPIAAEKVKMPLTLEVIEKSFTFKPRGPALKQTSQGKFLTPMEDGIEVDLYIPQLVLDADYINEASDGERVTEDILLVRPLTNPEKALKQRVAEEKHKLKQRKATSQSGWKK